MQKVLKEFTIRDVENKNIEIYRDDEEESKIRIHEDEFIEEQPSEEFSNIPPIDAQQLLQSGNFSGLAPESMQMSQNIKINTLVN